MQGACILLNGDFSFLTLVDWQRAMRLVVAEKARVLKYSDSIIRSVNKVYQAPAVLVLIRVIRSVYRGHVPYSRKNVIIRDGFTCQYCGAAKTPLTIDHVVPKSKGGRTVFENCVASCQACNHQKGDRTPREAGMRLKKPPHQPTISEFVRLRIKQTGVYEYLQELGII